MGTRMLAVAGSLLVLAGCGTDPGGPAGGSAPEAGWTTFRDEPAGLTVRFPSGWNRAERVLTPYLTAPREVLSVATSPLAVNDDGDCAHLPVEALRRMGPADVFLTIQERGGADSAAHPPRTDPFELGRADRSEAVACLGRAAPIRTYWVPFADAGRSFYALVAVGDDAPAPRREALQRVLDGMSFARRAPSARVGGRGASRVPHNGIEGRAGRAEVVDWQPCTERLAQAQSLLDSLRVDSAAG